MTSFTTFRRMLLGISPDETCFDQRGFPRADRAVQLHLETAGAAFVDGYNAALSALQADTLVARLNRIEAMYRGFAFEGAAMALALLDFVTPWNRSRFQRFLESSHGDAHLYMLHVGAGWAIARIPWARRNFQRAMARYDPLYRWLALDGYGFHEGFFHTRQYVQNHSPPRRLSPHAARVFDQGIGRSLWFSQGGDVTQIASVVEAFPIGRQQDLWSGVGLAAAYAGGVARADLELLRDRGAAYAPQLAQGAAFAAKARLRAGNLVPQTELACDVFCQLPAQDAAAVTDNCLRDLGGDSDTPAYQAWRERISANFSLAEEARQPTMVRVPTTTPP